MLKTQELPALCKTLFIPLAVRARETARQNPLVVDEMAVSILSQCDTSGMIIDGGEISTHGILARTRVIDAQVKKLLAEHPAAVIVNLGAGLDTRFFRLDNGMVQWYDLDLPEVISLRKQFVSENERLHFISKSVLDNTWVNEIQCAENTTVILIAEGLLMYFAESEVQAILNVLTTAFPKADLLFDVVHRFFVGKKISSDFLWGLEKAREIEKLHQNVELIQSWSAGDILKERQSLAFRVLNIFPSTKNRSQIIHLKLRG